MAFQPVPAGVLVELIFSLNSQRIENTLWVTNGAVPDSSDLEIICGAVAPWWSTNLAPSLSTDLSLVQVDATYKGVATGPQFVYTTGLPDAGNAPTDSVPNGTAFVVKFGTSNIGRSFRGRNYIAGIPAASYVNSVLDNSTANAIRSAYAALPGVLSGIGYQHVVVSRRTGGALRPSGILTPVVSYSFTTQSSRSQRRRNPGVGS